MPKLRLLVVDDRAVSIEGLKNLLSTEDNLEIVAEAGDWWTAVK